MNSQDLYLKKQQAVLARKNLNQHGSSYDSTSTACFAFILLAMAVAGGSFFFIVMTPENPIRLFMDIAYIAAGIAGFFIVLVGIVRIIHNHSRKPLIREKQQSIQEYEQAIRAILKYDYGLIPADDRDFRRLVYHDILGESDFFVLETMTLDGSEKINLTLREVDDDSVIFTKCGVPYRSSHPVSIIAEASLNPILNSKTENLPVLSPVNSPTVKDDKFHLGGIAEDSTLHPA